ncbi:HTH-type transcriptional regulator MetR [Buchnera aphidicola (Eriosoma grossulariae)]|uniref:HTH-type transcriptional regulator MetR n=1 Tax=Buchnera aphidicola TaxID=9 RepID=UPI0034643ED2
MIEIKHLKILQELKNSNSITAAAIKLHQTQSALSHKINKLEQQLGFKLFIRKSIPLEFTVQGKILLNLSEKILPTIKIAMQSCYHNYKKTIHIAIECHSCIQWLIPILMKFKKKWPERKINLKSEVIFNPQPDLQKGKIDLVFTSDILYQSKLSYLSVFKFEIRLVMSIDHPLLKKKNILPIDLQKEIVMIYPIDLTRLDIWKHFLKPAGIIPLFKNVDNTSLLIQMVSAKMGVTALPYWVVYNFEKQGLVATRELGYKGLWSNLYAAIRPEEKQKSLIIDFVKFIKLNMNKLF